MRIGKSARRYQERRQPDIRKTLRSPGPELNLGANEVHNMPLAAPLPLPDLIQNENGNPPPDIGRTQAWPWGDSPTL